VEIEERLSFIINNPPAASAPLLPVSVADPPKLDTSPGDSSSGNGSNGNSSSTTTTIFPPEVKMDVQIFFYYINGFYDAYITLGAPFRIKDTSNESMKEFRRRLVHCKSVDASIFQPLRDATLDCMLTDHLDAFLASEDFVGVVRNGRNSILGISRTMKKPLAEALLRRQSMQQYLGIGGGGGSSSSLPSVTGTDDAAAARAALALSKDEATMHTGESIASSTASDAGAAESVLLGGGKDGSGSKADVLARIELKNFIHSDYSASLESYLQTKGGPVAPALLRFYLTSWSFQHNSFRNKFEQSAECCSIFDRYISRNSDEHIGVPDAIRKTVASELFLTNTLVFRASSDWAFDRVYSQHWKPFKAAVLSRARAERAAAKAQAKADDAENCSSSGSSTAAAAAAAAAHSESKEDGSLSPERDDVVPGVVGDGDYDDEEDEALYKDSFPQLASRYFPRIDVAATAAATASKADSSAGPYAPVDGYCGNSTVGGSLSLSTFTPPLATAAANAVGKTDAGGTSESATAVPHSPPPPSSSASEQPVSPLRAEAAAAAAAVNETDARRGSYRENCQQHRRRSINKVMEPARQVAMVHANRSYRRNSVGAVTTIGNEELQKLAMAAAAAESNATAAGGPGTLPSSSFSSPSSSPSSPARTTPPLKTQRSVGNLVTVAGSPISGSSPAASPSVSHRKTMFGSQSEREQRGALMRNILSHPCCCSIFKEYLERESSSQTILFIVEVEAYRRITNAAYQKMRARKIYNKFLHPLSIMPVPVSVETHQRIQNNVEVAGPALFKQAQDDVMDYVESCQFSKLVKAPEMALIENILRVEESSLLQESGGHHHRGKARYDHAGGGGGSRRRLSSLYFVGNDVAGDSKSLRFILRNQLCTRFFKDFCNRIFVNESLYFWFDAEYYQGLPSVEYMRRSAYKICRKYIVEDANLEINISYATKVGILDNLATPTRSLFKKAQAEIFKLLEQDALPQYIKGPEYAAMVVALQSSSTLGRGGGGGMSALQRVMSRFRL
jgi:hypothetical protein